MVPRRPVIVIATIIFAIIAPGGLSFIIKSKFARIDPTSKSSAPSSSAALLASSAPQEALLGTLFQAAVDGKLDTAVRAGFEQIGKSEMDAIVGRSGGAVVAAEAEGWKCVLTAVEGETQRRMGEAKKALEILMEAGEINELDRRIVRIVIAMLLCVLFSFLVVCTQAPLKRRSIPGYLGFS
jgi:hypothetical protein